MTGKKAGEGAGEGQVGVDRRAVTRSALLGASVLGASAFGASTVLVGCGAGGGTSAPKVGRDVFGDARQAGRTVRLPAPTGPHRTGVTTLHLVDRSRRDPWDPKIPVREVMVTVFYPARTVRGCPVARQMTKAAADVFKMIDVSVHHLPKKGVKWAATTTHSHTGAAPAAAPQGAGI